MKIRAYHLIDYLQPKSYIQMNTKLQPKEINGFVGLSDRLDTGPVKKN